MRQIEFPPLARPLSALALGTMHFRVEEMDWARQMLDAWTDAGGNVLDCAHKYGEGSTERAVGRWLGERANRADMVILTKGGHPDASGGRVSPAAITQDLAESLERLGTDYVDIYLLHRDDESVPVDELMDVLDQHHCAGLVSAVGVSNWRPKRIDQANAYAAARGLVPLSVSSPHLSLARQAKPPWPGCVSAADPASRSYYSERDLVVIPWSSQAGGFFAAAGDLSESAARVYDTPENRERLQRTRRVAEDLNVTPTQVALAWVLEQPFSVIPVVGAMNAKEILESQRALEIRLTGAQLAWLDLSTDSEFYSVRANGIDIDNGAASLCPDEQH